MFIGHLCLAVNFVHFAIECLPLSRVLVVYRLDYYLFVM